MDTQRELRILQICSSSAISGAETNVLSLSTQLRKRGHYVQTITPAHGWLPSALFEEEIPNTIMGMRGTGWWRTVGYSIKQIRSNRVDLVHTHLTRAAYIGRMIGTLTRKPIVTSVHIANNDNIYRHLARRRNRLVAVSDFVHGMLHGMGVPERYIETVYNGTNLYREAETNPFLTKKALGIDPAKEIIGVVGKVCREKGHVELLRAMKQVMVNSPSAHLLLVGKVSTDFSDEFQQELKLNNLRDHVTLTGEQYNISPYFDVMNFSAMPSHMETFGVSALEAMARGKAVVATRVGGLPELVKDGQTGLLVGHEVSELASALSYLLGNKTVCEEMGVRGRNLVLEKFTLDQMVTRFESVYRNATFVS